MRISNVKIKNFRNFLDLDVDLSEHAVIVGQNKIGKSNLIFALRLILDPSLPDSARELGEDDFNDTIPRPLTGAEAITISVDITDFEDNTGVFALLSDHAISATPMVSRLTYELAAHTGVNSAGSGFEWTIYGGDRSENDVSSYVRRRMPFTVLSA